MTRARGGAPSISITGDTAGLGRAITKAQGLLGGLNRTNLNALNQSANRASISVVKIGTAGQQSQRGLARLSATGTSALARIQTQAAATSTSVGTIGSSATRAGAAVTAAAGAATAALTAMGVSYNANQDRQRVALEAMTGSAAQAQKIMRDIAKLAESSPTLSPQIAGGGVQQLMAYGLEADRALLAVRRIGDASAAAGKSVEQAMGPASLAIGQIQSKGKLSAEELNQLAESVAVGRGGVAKQLGMTGQQLEDALRGGKVSAERGLSAVFGAMEERSKGAAEKMAQTTEGRMDRLKEILSRKTGEATRPLYDLAGKGFGAIAASAERLDTKKFGALVTDLGAGLSGKPKRQTGALSERAASDNRASRGEQIGTKVRDGATKAIGFLTGTVGPGVKKVGAQILDALKPAQPFLQNVLIPLLTGVGKGVIASVVTVFQIAVPVIKGFTTVLGAVGRVLSPLRKVFEGVGVAIGFLFGGPILKGIGLLAKLGGGLKFIGPILSVLSAPLRLVGGLLVGFSKAVGVVVPWLAKAGAGIGKFLWSVNPIRGVFKLAATSIGTLITKVGGLFGAVKDVASGIARPVADLVGKVVGGFAGLVGKIVTPFAKIGSAIANAVRSKLGGIANFFGKVGKAIIDAIVKAIKTGAGAVGGAVKDVVSGRIEVGGVNINPLASRNTGGAIDGLFLGAGGEMLITPSGSASMIPGDPRSDSTLMWAPPGSSVITGHGQSLLAAGASLPDVLRYQLPHFAEGGVIGPRRTAVAAKAAGFRGQDRVLATAIAGAESGYRPGAIGVQTPFGRARGLMQIMLPVHQALMNRLGGDWANPVTSMRAAYRISGAKNWKPWEAFTNGAYQRFLPAARDAVRATGGNNPRTEVKDQDVKVPRLFGRDSTRAGLIDGAFGTAFDNARAGTTPSADARIKEIREAMAGVQAFRQVNARGVDGIEQRTGTGTGSVRSKMWRAAKKIAGRPYVYGGGHDATGLRGGSRGYDCSSAVSYLLNAGGFAGRWPMTTDGLKTWGRPGAGKQITIGVRGSSGRGAHTMLQVGGWHFEAGRGGVGFRRGWSGSFPIKRHPPGFRAGGVIGTVDPRDPLFRGWGLNAGGKVAPNRLDGAMASYTAVKGGSLQALNAAIEDATLAQISRLRTQLLSAVKKGGTAAQITRLQGALTLIDQSIGARAGRLMQAVDRRRANVAAVDTYRQLGLRRAGIDASSSAGLQSEAAFLQATAIPAAQQNEARIKQAIARARKSGDKQKLAELQEELRQTQLEIAEGTTRVAELGREIAAAQKAEAEAEAERQATARYAGFGTRSGVLDAALIAAQIATPGSEGAAVVDDAAVVRQQLENASAAYAQAVADNDIDRQKEWGQSVLSLRDSLKSLEDAVNTQTQSQQEQIDLMRQARDAANQRANRAEAEVAAITGWIGDVANQAIGRSAGRGMGSPGSAGSLARI